ncbi:MAG TPA: hypothetical protein H9774_13500 [Candidatus Desulfovibrio gallistercoris]|nr:hypothetical protein [Candidatus Desulfovibrio gallistercoris]
MLKRSICLTCLAVLLLTGPCLAGDKSVSELRQIVQAGGSLILDISNRRYSVTELLTLAAALRDNATLTIRMDRGGELSTVDCLRLSKSRPGQIRFWF